MDHHKIGAKLVFKNFWTYGNKIGIIIHDVQVPTQHLCLQHSTKEK
jgi:hypothetical protein